MRYPTRAARARPIMRCLLALTAGLAACDDPAEAPPPDAISPDGGPALDMAPLADAAPDAEAPDLAPADAGPPDAAMPCSPDGEPAYEPWPVGSWAVDIDPETGAWRVHRPGDDAVVLRSPDRCVDGVRRPIGRVGRGAPAVETSFGNFQVGLDGRRSRIEWQAVPPEPAGVTRTESGVEITYAAADGTPVALRFAPDAVGLRVELVAEGVDAGGFGWRCGEDTGFFGLGTQVTGLDLRGRRYPLFTQEQGIGKPENGQPFPLANVPEAAYAPMGVWHASAGYSAVVTHDAYSQIDLCAADPTRVELESFAALPGFALLPGLDLRSRMTALGGYVGRPPDVPDWVFAPWNDAVGGPERLEAVTTALREAGVPSSAVWSEDWIGGDQSATGFRLSYAWEWDPAQYPDLPEDIERLHGAGFAFLAYFNPFVPEPTRMFTEGLEGGWLVQNADGEEIVFRDPAFRNAGLVDLTDPAALDWLRGYQVTAARDLGIDGWMADFAEWLPVESVMRDGTSGWRYHNRYPLRWQQANVEAMREAHAEAPEPDDWTFFVRSGWASVEGGSAGLAPALWAGDQNTDWGRDDGFPTVIPIGVHVGLAGVAVYGSDIAGYTSETVPNTTKELFYRWSSLGAFHPLMRTHHGSDECGNWAFDRDDDTLAHYRRYAIVHTLLYPYLRARMDEAMAQGWPIVRHPYFTAPLASGLWSDATDQYFLGDDLLIAPVVEPGAGERVVHLPGDGWWPLFGASPLGPGEAGPGRTVTRTVAAPVTEIPVFVRPGTALPLLPRPVDSFFGATDDGVSSLADLAGARRLALYPTADGVITPRAVDGATVEGTGWLAAPDWRMASLDGMPLPACDGGGAVACADGDGIFVPAAASLTLAVGDARLTITGEDARDWSIGWAGVSWGAWAEPTPVGELDPDIPPPCE